MRVPRDVPQFGDLLKEAINESPDRLLAILAAVTDDSIDGKYLHWNQLKYRMPPAGLSHREWWLGLRMKRSSQVRSTPFKSNAGEAFTFCLTDAFQQSLQYIDSLGHGAVEMPEPITNRDTRSRYVVRSLVDESITSSQIEGASTTREVAKEMILRGRPARDRSEQMILNNYRTMQRIIELGNEPLSKSLILEIHALVTEGTLDNPTATGRFRGAEETIDIVDTAGEILHVPPSAVELEERCQRLCAFANSNETAPYIHPVLRSIIVHFMLGYDHPFVDGNGRTARALFYWSMLRRGYWLFEFISISEIIVRAPVQYGNAYLYTETDSADLTYFLDHQIEVIRRAVEKLYEYVEHRTQAVKMLTAELRGMNALNHRQRELIRHALRHPGHQYTYDSHRRSHGVARQTARTDILSLVELGLLKKSRRGRVLTFTPAANLESKLRSAV